MSLVPLKHLVAVNERSLGEDTDADRVIRYIDIGSVATGRLLDEPKEMTFAEAPSRARRLVRDGDTIISTVRTYLRAVWPVTGSSENLVVSTGFAVLTPGPQLDARYLGWVAQSDRFVDGIVARSVGVSYPAINPGEIRELRIELREMTEQRAIANYLDSETARLDHLVAKKQSLLDRLDERIDAMVASTIGDSALADPTRPALEIRRLLSKVRRPTIEGQIVTAFRDGQVTARALRRAEGYTEAWTTGNAAFQGVRRGDVVVHGLDGFAGAVGTAEADGICSPVYHVMEPCDGGDSEFYGRLLHVLATTGYLGLFAVSTRERAVDFRNWDLFGRIPVPVVPPATQRAIGDRIRALRPLRAAIARSKALALEHRQALITAVVNGELKIPAVAS